MKRLVYSPSINVYVKTDNGVVDLSDYVTECSVDRKINQVSSASVTFRNPKVTSPNGKHRFMFTEYEGPDGRVGPVFHPMDPIIITMTRLRGKPIQVFTGYCDTTPYVQLFPGVATIKASCTLKKLLHTYWDPGLSFVYEFMNQYGWEYNYSTGTSINQGSAKDKDTKQLNDTGIGNLLMALLNEAGGWKKDDIYLQPLPSKVIQKQVGKLYDDLVASGKQAAKEYASYMQEFVDASASVNGGAGAGGGTSGGTTSSVTFPPGEGKVVTASWYSGDGGFSGQGKKISIGTIPSPANSESLNNGYWFAELSNDYASNACYYNGDCDFAAMGNLAYGTPVQVTYNNKSIIARKADVGGGGAGLSGHPRVIDLWKTASDALGMTDAGTALVKVKVLTESMVKDIENRR